MPSPVPGVAHGDVVGERVAPEERLAVVGARSDDGDPRGGGPIVGAER